MALGEAELADIARWNPIDTQVTAAKDPAYEKNYALFRRLYEQTKDIAKELSS